MNRIFLDTNLVLDILTKRAEHELAERILSLALRKGLSTFTSSISYAVADYLLRSHYKINDVKGIVIRAIAIIEPLAVDQTDIINAYSSDWEDNEDAIQYYCALRHNCDVIITRDKKFRSLKNLLIPVMAPGEFLQHF